MAPLDIFFWEFYRRCFPDIWRSSFSDFSWSFFFKSHWVFHVFLPRVVFFNKFLLGFLQNFLLKFFFLKFFWGHSRHFIWNQIRSSCDFFQRYFSGILEISSEISSEDFSEIPKGIFWYFYWIFYLYSCWSSSFFLHKFPLGVLWMDYLRFLKEFFLKFRIIFF